MLAAGNFGDWHAAVGEVPWSSVPKTPMNSHGKLVLHPLWNSEKPTVEECTAFSEHGL